MANKKNFWYVLVLTSDGPVFVTKVKYSDKTAYWDKLEKPLEMDMSRAKDLTFGLTVNGYTAFAVCHPIDIDTQPYRYEIGSFKWEFNDKKDKVEETA